MRMLLHHTRHTEVMALWGRVWMWHAVLVFVLFLGSNVLIWAGFRQAAPFVALWVIGLLGLMVPVWYYRFRDGPAMTPIERQLGQVWGMFAASCFLTGAIVVLMGLEVTPAAAGGTSVRTGGRVHGHDPGGLILRSGCGRGARAGTGRRAEVRPRDLRRGIRHRFVRPGLEVLGASRGPVGLRS